MIQKEKKEYAENIKYIDETFNELAFLQHFPKIIKSEKSYFGKMVLQENYISSFLVSLIVVLRDTINRDINNAVDIRLNIHTKELESYTLGKLIKALDALSSNKALLKDLKIYNGLRNDLTHNILHKYTDVESLEKAAERISGLGAKLINSVIEHHKKMVDNFLENMKQAIDSVDIGK